MSVARDAETARVLAESKRLREQLAAAVAELDRYVGELHAYVDRLNASPVITTPTTTDSKGASGDGRGGPGRAGGPGESAR